MSQYRIPTRKDWMLAGLVIGAFTAAVLLGAIFLAPKSLWAFLLPTCALLLLLVRWHAANFAYRCPACGNEFEISTFRDLVSPHMWLKYLRCPQCGKRGWAEILRKPHSGFATAGKAAVTNRRAGWNPAPPPRHQ